jgi:hypothetical protein
MRDIGWISISPRKKCGVHEKLAREKCFGAPASSADVRRLNALIADVLWYEKDHGSLNNIAVSSRIAAILDNGPWPSNPNVSGINTPARFTASS